LENGKTLNQSGKCDPVPALGKDVEQDGDAGKITCKGDEFGTACVVGEISGNGENEEAT
jgi:hypothetical protein